MKVFDATKKRDEVETKNNSISNDTDTDLWSSHHISPILFIFIISFKSNQIKPEGERKHHLKEIRQSAIFKRCGWMKNQFILYFVQVPMMTIVINWIFTLLCVRWINVLLFFFCTLFLCANHASYTLHIFYATINHFPSFSSCCWRSPFDIIMYNIRTFNCINMHLTTCRFFLIPNVLYGSEKKIKNVKIYSRFSGQFFKLFLPHTNTHGEMNIWENEPKIKRWKESGELNPIDK